MLSCSCDTDDYGWYFESPNDFTQLETKRRKRCCSCKELIDIGSLCVELARHRSPRNDIEEKIWGDMVSLASYYMCESCGEILFNLGELGYCLYLDTSENSMQTALKEYWEITGFKPSKGGENDYNRPNV